jgi:hypothetical protein
MKVRQVFDGFARQTPRGKLLLLLIKVEFHLEADKGAQDKHHNETSKAPQMGPARKKEQCDSANVEK